MGCYVSAISKNSLLSFNGTYRVNLRPACIDGPFERVLNEVYLTLCDCFQCTINEHGLPVKCVPLATLWFHFYRICVDVVQFVEALARIKWATVKGSMVYFFVDHKNTRYLRDTVVIVVEDLELIQGLIGFLKNPRYPWLEGCFISHLLEHCTSLKSFRGEGREKRFIQWVTKYPVFFSLDLYEYSTAVKWTGCDLLFDRWR